MRAIDLRDHRIHVPPARRRGRCEEIGVLGKERDDRDRADDIIRPPWRPIRGVATWTTAGIGGGRSEERDLESVPVQRGGGPRPRSGPACLDRHSRERSAPADHLGVLAGTRGFPARDDVHGLEDVRLPGTVRTHKCGNPRAEIDPSVFVAAEVL